MRANLVPPTGQRGHAQQHIATATRLDSKAGVRVQRIGPIDLLGRTGHQHFAMTVGAGAGKQRQRQLELVFGGTAVAQR